MLNLGVKDEAVKKLEKGARQYDVLAEETQERALRLYELRSKSSISAITAVEKYINNLARSPKAFDKVFSNYRVEFKAFSGLTEEIKKNSFNAEVNAGSGAGAGIAAGVGAAAMLPTAALAVATTFGTASTGTAIASLSGAVATKAALAWLGGGALAAGGGGMVAGNALLALAGPIGWAIGGLAIVGSGVYMRNKNADIADEAAKHLAEIKTGTTMLRAASREILHLIEATENHISGIRSQLSALKKSTPDDYENFSSDEKVKLGALKNHVESLSALLNKKVA
jgi:hypothetical protein